MYDKRHIHAFTGDMRIVFFYVWKQILMQDLGFFVSEIEHGRTNITHGIT